MLREVDKIQDIIQIVSYTKILKAQEREALVVLKEMLHRENIFWKEKARANWIINGDRNTKLFHIPTKIK